MDKAPGWRPDPERVDRERYWDGSAWTEHVRDGESLDAVRLPEHGHELHRAMAAATDDLDAVEARLLTMFERSGGTRQAGPSRTTTPPLTRDDGDDDVAFAELDAALIAEGADDSDVPRVDEPRRPLFRRRSKGATSARR
jgi:hypothetical protein